MADNAKIRVLVVEDSPTQAERLKLVLESEGFVVEVARDGQQGLARVQSSPFDMVLTDILMPHLTGYELCAAIKANEQTSRTPVILLTTLKDAPDIIDGLACGADNFITKPYEAHYLIGRVRSILASRAVREHSRVKVGVEAFFRGRKFTLSSNIEQILDFLISTFEEFSRTKQQEFESRVRNAELLLQEKALRFFTLSLDMLCIFDADGNFCELNPAWERVLGFTAEEFRKKPFIEFVHPDDRAATLAAFNKCMDGVDAHRFENRYVAKDGTVHWLLWSATVAAGERLMYAVACDITDRKRFEEDLRIRASNQQAVAEPGRSALAHAELGPFMSEAAALVARTLKTKYANVFELLPDKSAFNLRATAGDRGRQRIVPNTAVSQTGFTLLAEAPVLTEDFHKETRFAPPPLFFDDEVASGICVNLPGPRRVPSECSARSIRRADLSRPRTLI